MFDFTHDDTMRRLVIVEVTLMVTLTLALHREMSPQLHNHARRVIGEARKHYLQLLDANKELKQQLKDKDVEHSKLHSFHGRDEKAHSVSLISRAIVGSVDALKTLGFTLEELQESGVYNLIQKEFQDLNLCKKYDYLCDAESPYRTPDGSCNNLDNPTWGKRFEAQSRILPAAYDNGVDSPRTRSKFTNRTLPNPRTISNAVHRQEGPMPILSKRITLNVFQMGQFLNHDFIATPLETDVEGKLDCCKVRTRKECFPVLIPKGDPHFPDGTCFNFIRSAGSTGSCLPGHMLMDEGGNLLPPPRVNTCHLTHTDEHCFLAEALLPLQNIRMKRKAVDTRNMAPTNRSVQIANCDARVHENPSLVSYHTLFVQRHNIIAKKLENLHLNWTKERIFQEAKKINVAVYQHVVYNEFLPALMPARALKQYKLKSKNFGYSTSYNSTLDVTTANEFGIAFRFGHSIIPPDQTLVIPGKPLEVHSLVPNFDNPHLLYLHNKTAAEYLMRWLFLFSAPEMDRQIVPEVRDRLFENDKGKSLDLIVLNIQRGRDHGIQPYGEYRKWCGLSPLTASFDSLVDHDEKDIKQLRLAYNDPRDIDLFPGLVSEKLEPDSSLGKTLTCIMGSQFRRFKEGDRYWYENPPPAGFTLDQLNEIRKTTMAMIICSVFDIDELQLNVFKLPNKTKNPIVNCTGMLDIDFAKWQHGYEPVKSLGSPVFDELSKILRDFGAD